MASEPESFTSRWLHEQKVALKFQSAAQTASGNGTDDPDGMWGAYEWTNLQSGVHEFFHTIGARHADDELDTSDIDNDGNTSEPSCRAAFFDYSCAHYNQTKQVSTLMNSSVGVCGEISGSTCYRKWRLSNPNENYRGVASGVASSVYNTCVIKKMWNYTSHYSDTNDDPSDVLPSVDFSDTSCP